MDTFEKQRRRLARLALYGSLAVVLGGGLAAWRWLDRPASGEIDVAWYEEAWEDVPAVRLLQQYLRVDTGPAGDELAGALLLATPLRAAGLPVTVEPVGAKANLWARLEGADPRALVLLSHLDVEPVEAPEVWVYPPFSGTIALPYIWGRGAFDMKSYTIAQLWALLELRRRPTPPARTVTLVASSSEERGSDLGLRYLLWRHPELFADAWAVLTEGGLVEARNTREPKYWATEYGQKRFVALDACAASRERLEALQSDVWEITGMPLTGLRVLPEVAAFWDGYAPTRDRDELKELFGDPHRLDRDPEAFLRLPQYARSMVRDELVTFEVEQEADGSWHLPMLFHLLPGSDLEAAMERLLPEWTRPGVSFVLRPEAGPDTTSPLDHPAVEGLHAAIAARYPGTRTGPFFLPWTMTDSRFLRPLGVPAYGFTPFLIVTPETLRAARGNEKIALPGFRDGVALYVDVVRRLATLES